MINIISQASIVKLVLQKANFDHKKRYRLCTYTVILKYKEKILLFNTLTRELIALEKAEYKNIETDINLYKILIEKYFYVEENFDEKKISDQISNFAKVLSNKNNLTHFIVYPTMDCNARCFYCFEHGSKKYHMTDKIAEDVADYIINKSNGKEITIQWFGGEPLYNIKAIDIIVDKLVTNNIEFRSKMVSNGYLLTKDIVKRAKEKWNLNFVQITLDGTRNVYNRIKNYIYEPNSDAFDKVIDNIKTVLQNGIRVYIRINIGKNNCDDLFELVKYLCYEFKGFEKLLSIYGSLLFDNWGAVKTVKSFEERRELTDKLLQLENYAINRGFGLKGTPKTNVALNMCGADSDNNLTILPNGNIGKCEHYSEQNLLGNIYEDIIDESVVDMWKEHREEVELCEKCSLYPQCIRLKHCPDMGLHDCDIIDQKRQLSILFNQMKNAYDKYLMSVNKK